MSEWLKLIFVALAGAFVAFVIQERRTHRVVRPTDAMIHDQQYCAASVEHIGKRIILDGAELGPCTTKDIGRKP